MNYFISILSDIIVILLGVQLWKMISYGKLADAVSLQELLTYIILVRVIAPIDMSFVTDVQRRIIDGNIVSELLRPINFSLYLFSQESGRYLNRVLFRYLPVYIMAFLIFDGQLPASPAVLLLFLLSLILSFVLMFIINYITSIAAFWVTHLFSLNVMKGQIVRFFSGYLVPLWFFPQSIKQVIQFSPFAAVIFMPIQIYQSKELSLGSFMLIGLQILWILFFLIIAKWIWKKAIDQMTVNGG